MKVLIFGANGMLGHKVYQACREHGFDTWLATRRLSHHQLFEPKGIIRADLSKFSGKWPVGIGMGVVDVVVNCAGVVKQQTPASTGESYAVNSVAPHRIAAACAPRGIRLIHISTDCVFSGRNGEYTEADAPDPVDTYGWSKLLGELHAPRCLTLRTSFIGRELEGSRGLVEWLIGNRGKQVRGFTEAVFSGLTTLVLANLIVRLLTRHPYLYGVYHVGAEPISKFHLLHLLNEAYDLDAEILSDSTSVVLNRSLGSSRFRTVTNWSAPSWPDMIEEMRADPTPYDEWRK